MTTADIIKHIDRYIKKLIADKKSIHTINNYKSSLKDFKNYIEDMEEETEYSTQQFRELVFDYLYSLDNSYKINSINMKRTAMRGFISYLAAEKYIDEDFSKDINKLKRDTGKKSEVLTSQEIKKVLNLLVEDLNNAEGYNIYYKARNILLFTFLLYTGVRRSECVKVKWADIDMINNEIAIHGKNNKTRYIPLKRELKYQLMDYKGVLEELENAGYEVKSEYIFRTDQRSKDTKKKDKPMTPKNVYNIIKDIMKRAGVNKNITPHNIRHNFASYFIQSGGKITTLSGVLGHSNPNVTTRIYMHEIEKKQREEDMNKLDFGI